MIITTNMDAMKTLRSLDVNNRKSNKTMEKLASGLKINRAADDAAGLAISEKMLAQIRGLNQASRNCNDGISLVLTAQGGLMGIDSSLQRIRELCIEAATDTMTDDDRQKAQDEIDQLLAGIDQTAKRTKFNTIPLLAVEDVIRNTTTTRGFNHGNPVALNVASNGAMTLRTIPGNSEDRLNFSTSSPHVKINGSTMQLSSLTATPVSSTATQSVIRFTHASGVAITQTVSITGPDNNIYRFAYSIENTSATDPATVSLAFGIDTCLGNSDNAPAIVDGTNTKELLKNNSDIFSLSKV